MNDFVFIKTRDSMRPYVCFINTVDDVYFFLDDIKEEATRLGMEHITIDLFLINGYAYNRFFNYVINNSDLSIVNPREIGDYVYESINKYISSNISLLEQSALSPAMQQIVIKQIRNSKG